jgi:hypothetical protein
MGKKFFMNGLVGIFDDPPQTPGIYSYEPCRSVFHLALHQELKSGATPRCHYDADGTRVTFTVVSSPGHGKLELANFETAPA